MVFQGGTKPMTEPQVNWVKPIAVGTVSFEQRAEENRSIAQKLGPQVPRKRQVQLWQRVISMTNMFWEENGKMRIEQQLSSLHGFFTN
jgi:hypothetical protein